MASAHQVTARKANVGFQKFLIFLMILSIFKEVNMLIPGIYFSIDIKNDFDQTNQGEFLGSTFLYQSKALPQQFQSSFINTENTRIFRSRIVQPSMWCKNLLRPLFKIMRIKTLNKCEFFISCNYLQCIDLYSINIFSYREIILYAWSSALKKLQFKVQRT